MAQCAKRITLRAIQLLTGGACLALLAGLNSALAQKIRFSVGPDEALAYPSALTNLADEHATIFPPGQISTHYLFFASSGIKGATGGAVVLQTSNLKDFAFADGYATQVMTPPIHFTTCKSTYDPEFDLNFAAPGSVVEDPTLPPGNLIMIYEAENHCPGAYWQHDFYATAGLARSSDYGKTWPVPIDNELGGDDRYAVLKNPISEPDQPENPQVAIGNAIPSAIVAPSVGADGSVEYYLYVVYNAPGPGNDGMLRLARAMLGVPGRLQFAKWYNDDFSEPGIQVSTARSCRPEGAPGVRTWGRSAITTSSGCTSWSSSASMCRQAWRIRRDGGTQPRPISISRTGRYRSRSRIRSIRSSTGAPATERVSRSTAGIHP